MHPEKLGFEDCDLSSIFKVIDKETQTNVSNTIKNSDSTSKSYKLPLPRELQKPEEGTIKVFSFCQIIQDPECPTSITIVRESVTEEVHSHSNTPDNEAFSNRYRYCKEVIKPYLRDYPPDCPDSGELLLRDAIITANEEFPEYPPCYEIPNSEEKKSEEPQEESKKPEKKSPETKSPEEPRPTKKPEEPGPTKKSEEPGPTKKLEEPGPTKKSEEPGPTKKPEKPCILTLKDLRPETEEPEKPPVEPKKPEEPRPEFKKPEEQGPEPKKTEEVKQATKYIPPLKPEGETPPKETSKFPKKSDQISPGKSKKPVEEKKEKRRLILCPNEKIPKICIEITDPQICQEILKKKKLLEQEQQKKEDKDTKESSSKEPDDKSPKKGYKEIESKRTEENSKGSDDKRTVENSGKESDDKRTKKSSCIGTGDRRIEEDSLKESDDKRTKEGPRRDSDDKRKENSRPDKPKKRPCTRNTDKNPEDSGRKEKPPTESQKSSHPEKPCKLSAQPEPPKQPEEKKEYYPQEFYPPVVCPPEEDDDDCYCTCGAEVKDEPRPPKPEKEIVVLPKQEKKPSKSDKSGWPSNNETKPCPNKKDYPPLPRRKDCLGKLLDSLQVKSINDEACKRKPIHTKMDETAENPPNKKKCAPRPKTPSTVTSVPVDSHVKESKSERKVCKPKTSKCDIKKDKPKCPEKKKDLDDGRCYCGKDGHADKRPEHPLNCKSQHKTCPPGYVAKQIHSGQSHSEQSHSEKSQSGQEQVAQAKPVHEKTPPARPVYSNTAKVETCPSIDKDKNVKTALQAHTEAMATLKCAMEDFMCKVFRTTQDAVTLITTESAKQLQKFKKSKSNTDCPPPKKVSDSRSNNSGNLRRFSVVNIDSSPKDLPDCVPPPECKEGASRYLDLLVKKVDSALSMISDTLVFEIPKPARPSNFNDTSSKYDIPVSSRPLPKDIENVVDPPTTSSMFTTIKDTLWSMFCDDDNSDKASISNASSANTASSESGEDLLNKLID